MDRTWPQGPFACVVLGIACRVRDESYATAPHAQKSHALAAKQKQYRRTQVSRVVTAALGRMLR